LRVGNGTTEKEGKYAAWYVHSLKFNKYGIYRLPDIVLEFCFRQKIGGILIIHPAHSSPKYFFAIRQNLQRILPDLPN
jgi:hypothetical protein